MISKNIIFKIASVDSLIIYFGDKINHSISAKVQKAYQSIKNENIAGLIEIIPSYSSLFITYDICKYDYNSIKKILENSIDMTTSIKEDTKIITIDVYYGTEVGFDLENISLQTNLTIDKIIDLHSSKLYTVYAIGFLPGFAYLANVDEKIAIPRRSTPRKIIPKGSLAIADTQTAIYPQNSPGGWNIIGRTTMELFDKDLKTLSPLIVGYKVQFNPISKEQFILQGGKI